MKSRHAAALMALSLLAWPQLAIGLDADAGNSFFESKIRPVLAEQCYQCHSTGGKQRGGLMLDSRDGVRKGGDHGPALAPGKPNDSLLIKALRHLEPKMPPKGKLPDAVVADFVKWIEMGAPDPRDGKTVSAS